MKIKQIYLKAYGHFTERRLSLDDNANFHIICGPNEAGKTTLRRAINGALFGIPERSQDTFLHDPRRLRVGLQLESVSGEELAIMRRKGRVNTLLRYDPASGDEAPDVIPDDQIREWLGGLNQGLFVAMFSLDHETLVRGGEALVQGKGEAGETLFEAGAGLTSVRSLLAKLERESEALFKPRAPTSMILQALSNYTNLRRQANEAALRPADYAVAKSSMEATHTEYEAARAKQSALQLESRRLERLSAILPDIAALNLAQDRLAELSNVPVLHASASTERIAAATQLDNATESERVIKSRLEKRQGELDSIQYNEAILVEYESIEALHHATVRFHNAITDLATTEAAIEDAEKAFTAACKQISTDAQTDEVIQRIPDATKFARIRALITAGSMLKANHESDLRSLREKQSKVERLQAELIEIGEESDATRLSAYLDSIADLGDPDTQAQQLDNEVQTALAKLDAEARNLNLPSADAVAATTVPTDSLVNQFRIENDELRSEARSTREAIDRIKEDLANLQAEIKGLVVRGEVPTKQSVLNQRSHRDTLWLSIRRRFMPLPGESPADEPPPAEEYERAVITADEASDSLFIDAERATRFAELRNRESQMKGALKLKSECVEAIAKQKGDLLQRWNTVLADHQLPSLAITEAAEWNSKRRAFLLSHEDAEAKRQEAAQKKELALQIRNRIGELLQELQGEALVSSERLSELLARARMIAKEYGEKRTQRERKKLDLAMAQHELTEAEDSNVASFAKLEDWKNEWEQSMQTIKLAEGAGPEEATARIDQFITLQHAHNALEIALSDRRTIAIEIEDYKRRLVETWQRVRGVTIREESHSPDILAAELYRELTDARTLQLRKNTLIGQVVDDQLALEAAIASAGTAQIAIDSLMLQANCTTMESLKLVEERSHQRAALEDKVRDIEGRLVESSGIPLAEALASAAGQDPETVEVTLSNNLKDNEDAAANVQKLHEQFINARKALEAMDGSSLAADAEQTLAQHSARITQLCADYAAFRIASAVLEKVIETYQRRNHGPLIELASKHYAAITDEKFSGVAVDFDEDQQIIKPVRAGGERLTMEELSTGRRDQLFLALRLAAIQVHIEKANPLPIIVDDILIHFDDTAAAATFKVLADLSLRTQVIFLTHHEHLLEIAKKAIGDAAYNAHSL